ncbi:DUF4352 domain-containing protein [Embleya sp. MST-111070]|uniref:DUF4352 domain-containing protein n=1 Tax=Embleya sp. MST-111070 TaxID=3398231 RepID=UPI003F734714
MRRLIALTAGSLLLIASAACGPSDEKVTNKPAQSGVATSGTASGTGSASPGGSATNSSNNTVASVGSTLDLKGITGGEKLSVTVLKVTDNAVPKNQFSEPETGSRLVSVQFKLENTGSKPYNDAPSNSAKLIDSDGQSFNAAIVNETTAGPALNSVTINTGAVGSGWITFEVPKSAQLAKVQFTMDSGFSNNTGEWLVR